MSPPCESYLSADQLDQGETFYPLNVRICEALPARAAPGLHSGRGDLQPLCLLLLIQRLVGRARPPVRRGRRCPAGLDSDSFVVEVASNDGYLLQHVAARGIRCHGIEPAANVAEAARAKGIPTTVTFLGEETGRDLVLEHGPADLVVANNVFAHVPDIVDFAEACVVLAGESGTVTIEIPHLLRLIEGNLYDTIYHEHYSYLSLLTTQRVLEAAGLTVVDVDELSTHGGSLRTWSVPTETAANRATRSPRSSRTNGRQDCTRWKATTGSPARWPPRATI